jgi:DNA invertase Pin-like site-specific DNA recombinase
MGKHRDIDFTEDELLLKWIEENHKFCDKNNLPYSPESEGIQTVAQLLKYKKAGTLKFGLGKEENLKSQAVRKAKKAEKIDLMRKHLEKGISKETIMAELNISRATYFNYLAVIKEETEKQHLSSSSYICVN